LEMYDKNLEMYEIKISEQCIFYPSRCPLINEFHYTNLIILRSWTVSEEIERT